MLKEIRIQGFKSFAKKGDIVFSSPIVSIVGPNGSGKSNVAEAFRFVLGEQSMKAMRGSKGEDLIWNGTSAVPRANKASVEVVFDNTQKLFPFDYSEVIISRAVYRDGQNEYSINGSKVRLKDIHELLAKVHIGSTGHHIISQGQADKILNASPKDRREMLEDALGLTAVELKREESIRKLQKTKDNITQVELLRREAAPRLRMLEKQIEKQQKLAGLQHELAERGALYSAREGSYIQFTAKELLQKSREPREKLERNEELLQRERLLLQQDEMRVSKEDAQRALSEERLDLERKVRELRSTQSERERELGSIEGKLSVLTETRAVPESDSVVVPRNRFQTFEQDIDHTATVVDETKEYAEGFHKLRGLAKRFIDASTEKQQDARPDPSELIKTLTARKAEIESGRDALQSEIRILTERLTHVAADEQRAQTSGGDREKTVLVLAAEVSELRSIVREFDMKAEILAREKHTFEDNVRELATLLDTQLKMPEYTEALCAEGSDRARQEAERQSLERLKIKIEEIGVVGEDITKEYADASARDAFLVRELEDLTKAEQSLMLLIAELEQEMTVKFSEGVKEINAQFTRYFSVLFGGGEAALTETRETKKVRGDDGEEHEEGEVELGVDVRVHLPRKKVSTLSILSGGERALTSIALIFAMSQVNPPPFIILDETDAALDEANSARYADMIRMLSEHSQLIVITHNRATMSAAGVLYGVTMGNDGVSKLLSVKLEEAQRVAK